MYSQKYWWEMNLALEFQIITVLVYLNLVVQYRITIHVCIYLVDFNLVAMRQTTKSPNSVVVALWYSLLSHTCVAYMYIDMM